MAHTERMRVTFADVDVKRHVNNARYFTFMETARTVYYLEMAGIKDAAQIDIIVARASCEFVRGLRFGEDFEVVVWPSRIGTSSFDFKYLVRTTRGEAVARGETVQVTYDYPKSASKPIPTAVRKRLEAEMARGPGVPLPA